MWVRDEVERRDVPENVEADDVGALAERDAAGATGADADAAEADAAEADAAGVDAAGADAAPSRGGAIPHTSQ